MSLFGKKEKDELQRLRDSLPPEAYDLAAMQEELKSTLEELVKADIQLAEKKRELASLSRLIIFLEDESEFQSCGLYTPRYPFQNSEEYKTRLDSIRAKQKDMVKTKTAVTGARDWTVNGDKRKGAKMIADMQKLLLRAFNAECDEIVEKVRYSNLDASQKRITASRDAISKLGTIMSVSISDAYYRLKMEELYLAFEYQQKKQEEKEAQKEAKAQLREAAKLEKELEAERKKLEKERSHYQNALNQVNAQLERAAPEERAAIQERQAQIMAQLDVIADEFDNVDYRAANHRAGYVYIISNIGAFGEGVYKIGMTRRLDPMDRVDELGDASVPFDFDVHAMIFSEDAPGLESALHRAFEDRKVNFVNHRREFFRVSLDEIKRVVRQNYDKTVEFVEVPPAEQYRQSLAVWNASR